MSYLTWNASAHWESICSKSNTKEQVKYSPGEQRKAATPHTFTPFIPPPCKCLLYQKPNLSSAPAGSCALRSLSEMFYPGDLNQKACHVLWQVKLTYFEARSIYQVVGMARLSLAIIDDIQFRAKLAIKLSAGKFTGTPAAMQTKTTTPLIEVLKCKWLLAESMKKINKAQAVEEKKAKEIVPS